MNPSPADCWLLRDYADTGSEASFVELVRRHIDFVYSIALRQLGGDAHLAHDVTQTVFVTLARKAGSLANRNAVEGWLCRTTQYAAADVARSESRRRRREQRAVFMHETNSRQTPAIEADQIRPLLDEAIAELREVERDAVLLRFFRHRSYAEVGNHLRLTESAARMRVERALGKLQGYLAKRGVTSSAAAIAVSVANIPTVAAPTGLVATVTGAALASGGATAGTSIFLMGMTKLQTGIACAVVMVGAVSFVAERNSHASIAGEIAARQRAYEVVAVAKSRTEAQEAAMHAAQEQELVKLRDEGQALRTQLQAISMRRPMTNEAPRGDSAFTGPYFESRQVERQPRPAYQATPFYPPELRRMNNPGKAVVDVIVDAEGVVRNAHVVEVSHPAFGDSALEAVKRWRYEPAQKDGQPVAMHMTVPVVYQLEGKPAADSSAKPAAPGPTRVFWF